MEFYSCLLNLLQAFTKEAASEPGILENVLKTFEKRIAELLTWIRMELFSITTVGFSKISKVCLTYQWFVLNRFTLFVLMLVLITKHHNDFSIFVSVMVFLICRYDSIFLPNFTNHLYFANCWNS